jgi:hypothetical protein
LIRDYAAALATAIQKRFLGPRARGKSPHVSVPEAESFIRWHDSTNLTKKVRSLKIGPDPPSEPRQLNAVEIKDPKPALTGSGGPEGMRRPQVIPPSGMEMGQTGKNAVEREKDG